MATDRIFAVAYLRAVEKKNGKFFAANKFDIMDFVSLKGKAIVTVHITNDAMPENIIYEIETMFGGIKIRFVG
ncbi:hypothetical protein D0C36_22805 [Mucilaginibacter conchicola]|uniref:Uncharacterized protein n=1 Tax=Mucilaginibacter conchicola TaxID=2303333 RepID=A0A372NNX0_9SPHI|nr:hypothetical protein [Mucilaginibacter conchicola]RFZ90075.1 hypothetical protein D0C36_22805 [Mucilaginibacter conchicola]